LLCAACEPADRTERRAGGGACELESGPKAAEVWPWLRLRLMLWLWL
jgi:hypothetical protein